MKFKRTVLLAAFVVALGLLLGTSAAQAATVNFDPNNPTRATGIDNLDIDGTLYNVVFTSDDIPLVQIYGQFPGTFDFDTQETAGNAADAVNNELDAAGALSVGAGGSDDYLFYNIGFESGVVDPEIEVVVFWSSGKCVRVDENGNCNGYGEGDEPWVRNIGPQGDDYDNPGKQIWAAFTLAGSTPGPVTIGGSVSGLEGSGLVLQNNGTDDLPRDSDGPFTFATPLTPGIFYNVTVATQPKNPTQICSVENGSAQVPDQAVTDVAVSCAEPLVGNVSKVVEEGDTLPDDTILNTIFLEGGVSLNSLGEVAFHGETSRSPAVFTQDGLVVKKFQTLPDGTTVDRIYYNGGVAINLLGQVAFHGRDNDGRTEAAFTKSGLVAKEGDPLEDDTIPEVISANGKVAINLFGQVAFHGQIEVGEGLKKETFRAVFTQDGLVAQEAVALPDNNIIVEISDTSGVAINDFGQVAFHGEVVDPGPGPGSDTLSAVFTQDGLLVKEGDTLPDGNIVGEIRKNGGVAINLLGQVVFRGRTGGTEAVFISDGLDTLVVAREDTTLPDGTTLTKISDTSGVAINDLGQVAFHGQTGVTEAVFTQNGLVAKEGDNLTDGTTTLEEISDTGGVAINNFGEVVFHGKGNNIDAVFISGSESPSNPPGEGDLFKSITW